MSNSRWCHLVSCWWLGIGHGVRRQESGYTIEEKTNEDSFYLSSSLFEPQNIEQGISNIEVSTSSFCGSLFCCSTCPPSRAAQARRAGIQNFDKFVLCPLISVSSSRSAVPNQNSALVELFSRFFNGFAPSSPFGTGIPNRWVTMGTRSKVEARALYICWPGMTGDSPGPATQNETMQSSG